LLQQYNNKCTSHELIKNMQQETDVFDKYDLNNIKQLHYTQAY